MHEYRRFVQAELDKRGWTPGGFARMAGMHRQTITKIVNDTRDHIGQMPDESTLAGIADGFKIDIALVRQAAARSLAGYVEPTTGDPEESPQINREIFLAKYGPPEKGGSWLSPTAVADGAVLAHEVGRLWAAVKDLAVAASKTGDLQLQARSTLAASVASDVLTEMLFVDNKIRKANRDLIVDMFVVTELLRRELRESAASDEAGEDQEGGAATPSLDDPETATFNDWAGGLDPGDVEDGDQGGKKPG